MDPLSSVMVRLSLLWLLGGFILGGLMLVDREIPGNWRLWVQPTHGHMLFVGWFLQFALGIAYWLLPRKRSPERPVGYNLRLAQVAVAALNIGLLCRVIAEPIERSGQAGDSTGVARAVGCSAGGGCGHFRNADLAARGATSPGSPATWKGTDDGHRMLGATMALALAALAVAVASGFPHASDLVGSRDPLAVLAGIFPMILAVTRIVPVFSRRDGRRSRWCDRWSCWRWSVDGPSLPAA
ncbi:MAG: hypothetical protein R2848_04575 [Thermomicrobiales bacterium]